MIYSCNGILSPSKNEWSRSMLINMCLTQVQNIDWKSKLPKDVYSAMNLCTVLKCYTFFIDTYVSNEST